MKIVLLLGITGNLILAGFIYLTLKDIFVPFTTLTLIN
jgi:hypothetical protein